ncbi:hypothetical protein [Aureimonas sp. AU12]|uniref:hypothetical protein n=1 Tax=Aureimonas sp. AU12 TaxID=1638161 RepID=UPI000784F1F4|nr:hypothetical protein [Aureimonas sp. AU12]
MRERRRQDGDGTGSALVFVGVLLLATPSILWFVLLSIGGTLTTIVVLPTWMASSFDAFWTDPIPNDIALTSGQGIITKAVGLIGILFLGPLGLFALGHLVVLLSARATTGRAGLRNSRRFVARCFASGLLPLLAVLAISIEWVGSPSTTFLSDDDGRWTIRWAIMSGWPMLPLLVLLAAETWSRPPPQNTRADDSP